MVIDQCTSFLEAQNACLLGLGGHGEMIGGMQRKSESRLTISSRYMRADILSSGSRRPTSAAEIQDRPVDLHNSCRAETTDNCGFRVQPSVETKAAPGACLPKANVRRLAIRPCPHR